ncbi:acyl-CoA thioester hydrolase [Breznakibacter xylanolyticus]|uniref:Acyl-CoA thioester hydrolase n=1 Tax=Breznakibacter xylanolyticus TaxID=990 RepID=A0A2W7NZQ9_9BACT|nr:thioesterase family protein [Breznakibacter xylanolyticus]PZX16702.1 acyl-CoA thioester hydrolase [Breznakibacter xylanolyticus]
MTDQPIHFPMSLPVQIRFNDIDPFGHVNNATYQEYFDLGRVQYFKQIFDGQLFTKDTALVIASIYTNFVSPVRLNDIIEVRTKIDEIGNKSLKMLQHVVDSHTGELKATCQSTMVCFRTSDHQTMQIPDAWREKFLTCEKG